MNISLSERGGCAIAEGREFNRHEASGNLTRIRSFTLVEKWCPLP